MARIATCSAASPKSVAAVPPCSVSLCSVASSISAVAASCSRVPKGLYDGVAGSLPTGVPCVGSDWQASSSSVEGRACAWASSGMLLGAALVLAQLTSFLAWDHHGPALATGGRFDWGLRTRWRRNHLYCCRLRKVGGQCTHLYTPAPAIRMLSACGKRRGDR